MKEEGRGGGKRYGVHGNKYLPRYIRDADASGSFQDYSLACAFTYARVAA